MPLPSLSLLPLLSRTLSASVHLVRHLLPPSVLLLTGLLHHLLTLLPAILPLRAATKLRTSLLHLRSLSLSLRLSHLDLWLLFSSLPSPLATTLLPLDLRLSAASALLAAVSATASLTKEVRTGSKNRYQA